MSLFSGRGLETQEGQQTRSPLVKECCNKAFGGSLFQGEGERSKAFWREKQGRIVRFERFEAFLLSRKKKKNETQTSIYYSNGHSF